MRVRRIFTLESCAFPGRSRQVAENHSESAPARVELTESRGKPNPEEPLNSRWVRVTAAARDPSGAPSWRWDRGSGSARPFQVPVLRADAQREHLAGRGSGTRRARGLEAASEKRPLLPACSFQRARLSGASLRRGPEMRAVKLLDTYLLQLIIYDDK